MNAITKTDVRTVVEAIVEQFEMVEFTPYQLHNVINSTFAELKSARTVRPQMMYNYRKNNLIAKGVTTGNFTSNQVIEFVTKYASKHVNS